MWTVWQPLVGVICGGAEDRSGEQDYYFLGTEKL